MNIAFRTDASLRIGTGHVMRCLTLADALKAQGADCRFICREHPGHLIDQIERKGYGVHRLSVSDTSQHAEISTGQTRTDANPLAHAQWLGASQEEDAAACVSYLNTWRPDWLVVDHYALDARWERTLRPHCRKLMVIDDLADRAHDCELLLDQNLGHRPDDYAGWVPPGCEILAGPRYALLRPEFAAWREYSLTRRIQPRLRQLLISMGGVDNDNVTGRLLDALKSCALPVDCRIKVVMGVTAPWLTEVRHLASTLPWETKVLANVNNMAELMAESDLAIGAAGATSWERCCLGLPTLIFALAVNQETAAAELQKAQAAICLVSVPPRLEDIRPVIDQLSNNSDLLRQLADNSSRITEGSGCPLVANYLVETIEIGGH